MSVEEIHCNDNGLRNSGFVNPDLGQVGIIIIDSTERRVQNNNSLLDPSLSENLRNIYERYKPFVELLTGNPFPYLKATAQICGSCLKKVFRLYCSSPRDN